MVLSREDKSQPRYHTGMLSGLRAIAEPPGISRRVLVYGGKRSFRTSDGIDVWPSDRLHHALTEITLWPCVPHSSLGSMQPISDYDPPPGTCVTWL